MNLTGTGGDQRQSTGLIFNQAGREMTPNDMNFTQHLPDF